MKVNGIEATKALAEQYRDTSERWLHIADTYGLSLSDDDVDRIEELIVREYEWLLDEKLY